MNFTFGVKIQTSDFYKPILHGLKITQNVAFLAFSTNFCDIKTDLSDKTVW